MKRTPLFLLLLIASILFALLPCQADARDETYKLWLDCNTNNSVVDIPGLSEKGEVYLSLAKTLSQSGCTFVYDKKRRW